MRKRLISGEDVRWRNLCYLIASQLKRGNCVKRNTTTTVISIKNERNDYRQDTKAGFWDAENFEVYFRWFSFNGQWWKLFTCARETWLKSSSSHVIKQYFSVFQLFAISRLVLRLKFPLFSLEAVDLLAGLGQSLLVEGRHGVVLQLRDDLHRR